MTRQFVFQIILLLALVIRLSGEEAPADIDRIDVKGGVVLTGQIVESNAGEIHLQTDYAGRLNVKTGQIERILTKKKLDESVPAELVASPSSPSGQEKAEQEPSIDSKTSADKPVVAAASSPPKPTASASTAKPAATPAKSPAKPAPPKSAPADDKYGWEIEAGMNFTGSAGNSDRLDLSVNIDSQYEQKFYRLDLYGRYSYGTNRDKLTANEIVLGSRYTNFFYKRFGFFIREELEHDKFEGIEFRSTTASGISYKLFDTKTLDFEARSGLSYRFEEDDRGNEEDFPGMDFGLDVRWQFSPYLSFKGSYGFIPSFTDSEAFIITQNSSFDIPFDKKSQWKIGLGLTTKYNNQAARNRENLDHKYFVRLIATWK